MNLKGKNIVLIGATGGIGRELVQKLDTEEANLVLLSKTESELQNLIKSLGNENHRYYVCDLSNQEETDSVSKKIAEETKDIDILINAAGVGIYKPIEQLTLDDWNLSFNINLTSVFIITKNLINKLGASSDSLVLNIGSGAGVIPMAGRSAYCSTKFALRGLTLSLSEEFKRVNNPKFVLITLGSTLTSFGPKSYETKKKEMEEGTAYFTPDWVANKLVEIIKDDKREVEYTLYPSDYEFGVWNKP